MRAPLLVSMALVASGAFAGGCGDDCQSGYVDTYGVCMPDGFEFQRADAVTSALVSLAADHTGAGTFDCDQGGTVTMSGSGTCAGSACMGSDDYQFAGCELVYDEIRGLSVRFADGSLHDEHVSNMGDPMSFQHTVSGEATVSGTVAMKGGNREFAAETCAMSFTDYYELMGITTVSGTFCGNSIELPLWR